MYTVIATLLMSGFDRRERLFLSRRTRTRGAPPELSILSDRELRDIGFRREPGSDLRRHVMWF